MASGSSADVTNLGDEGSQAQKLLQKHADDHHATVEEALDEDLKHDAPAADVSGAAAPSWAPTLSAKAAGKQTAQAPSAAALDTQSHELFPELGGPKPKANAAVPPVWSAKTTVNGSSKTNGAGSTNGTSRTSTPASGVATPTGPSRPTAPSMNIPGRNVETLFLEPQHVMPRAQLKRPIPDIIKDINRKSRANITMAPSANNRLKFEATGAQEVAQQALRDLVQQIGTKQSIKVPIPQSARAHIIGKQGSTIKSLQEKSGARIQLPKVEDAAPGLDDDDDGMIDVIVEGNALSAATARDAILKIAGERSANMSTRLRGIPAEFYPFIAGPKNAFVIGMEEKNGVQIRVPPHPALWDQPIPLPAAPGDRPPFQPAAGDSHIQLAGDRAAVQAVKAEIERRVEELRQQLMVEQLNIQKGRHQFIVGDRGIPGDDFFEETGCAVLLPARDDDVITIVGPADATDAALEKAMDLCMNMQGGSIDVNRVHRDATAEHALHLTRYLRARKEIERVEKAHNAHITTPFVKGGVMPWEFYSRDGKNIVRAQSEIKTLVDSHPPSRVSTVAVDPFFHQYLRSEVSPRVREEYGVHVLVPEASETEWPVVLVYESPAAADAYQVPRTKPTPAEVRLFAQGLRDAQQHILDLIGKQEEISTASIEVPHKFHDKLRRFIKREQESRPADQIPVRVSSAGSSVSFCGPSSATESLAAKAAAFVEQEKEDEKERGFTLSFEFPQKFANHLIGKGGSNIRELRDKFDVEIQVNDGMVELKGPKAKAEAAKAHIATLGRQLADEASYVLKVDPKFHRELIGAQGGQINRLQTRYKVLIFFPRSAKNANKDDESVADLVSEAGKPRRQQAPDEVMIRGPKKGADEARDELLSLLQYLRDNSFTATVTVQQKQIPSLIGSGGAALDELRRSTGAKVDIPNNRENPDAMVDIQIKGTKTQVAAAKKMIEEKKAVFDDTVVKTIDVDRKYHKTLIGAGGATLRDMVVKAGGTDDRRELARTVQFPKQEADGNTIKVEGHREVVEKIIAQIQSMVSERESQVTETVDVPVEKHRSLIGRGGDVRRNLESQFRVSVDVPRQGSGKTGVSIVGKATDVENAKKHILSLIEEQKGETVQVPRCMHHAISNNGQFFRRMRNDHSVTIDHAGHAVPPKPAGPGNTRTVNGGALPLITDDADAATDAHSWSVVDNTPAAAAATGDDGGEIPWVLKGSPENIDKVKKAIEAAMAQGRKSTATGYLVLPDPRTYRYVIGQGGSKVSVIRKQSGCRINVPDRAKDEPIEIVGTRDGIEKARDLILAAVREGSARD